MKLTVHAIIIARKGEMALALHILNGLGALKSFGLDCGSLLRFDFCPPEPVAHSCGRISFH